MTSAPTKPLISVITPCYNSAAFVEESISCVMSQGYSEVEMILVDDGSTDDTLRLLEAARAQYPARITVLRQDHRGPYPARNLGLTQARGEYIAFLDADDYWTTDCLEKLLNTLSAAGADIAYCGWQNVGTGAPGGQPYVPQDYGALDTVREFLRACPWPIHAGLVRRAAIDAVRGFSERCFSAMDYDLWLRLYAHTQAIVRVPEVLAFYRWHDQGQISRTRWRQVLDAVQVRCDFVRTNPTLVAHLSAAVRRELTIEVLAREAYRSLYRRQLEDARRLFRACAWSGAWRLRDFKYLAAAALPKPLFERLVAVADRGHADPT